jgi:hypothetical protein
MTGSAVRCAIGNHPREATRVRLVGVMTLVVWTLGIAFAVADTPLSMRILQNPTTTLQTRIASEPAEPAGGEIWISSDERLPATSPREAPPADQKKPGVKPGSQKEAADRPDRKGVAIEPAEGAKAEASSPTSPREISALAAAILGSRTATSSTSSPNASDESQTPQKSQTPQETQVPQNPQTPQSPEDALLAYGEATAEDRGEQSLPVSQAEARPESKDGADPAAVARQADEALFRTTSSPVKPAALVFRPEEESDATEIVRAASQEARPELQLPSTSTTEPDMQARPTGDPIVHVTHGHEALGGSGTSRAVLGARPPVRQPAMDGRAVRETPLERDVPAIGDNQVAAQARFVNPATRPAVPYRRRPMPHAEPVNAHRGPSPPQVILRVTLADLHRASAHTWGLADLAFSRRPPLLRSLLEAESGQGAVILDLKGNDELESQLQSLKEHGALRIRSQPTLVTASGRPVQIATGTGPANFVAGPDVQPSLGPEGLPADVTLVPVVTDQGYIVLEVTRRPRGPYFESGVAQGTAPSTGPSKIKAQMRPGQTLAITGSRLEARSDDQGTHPVTLTRVLGIGKSKRKQPETVILITPELAHARPSNQAAALAGHHALTTAQPRQGAESLNDYRAANSQRNRGVPQPDAAKKSRPANPFEQLWRMVKRKVPGTRSTTTR